MCHTHRQVSLWTKTHHNPKGKKKKIISPFGKTFISEKCAILFQDFYIGLNNTLLLSPKVGKGNYIQILKSTLNSHVGP